MHSISIEHLIDSGHATRAFNSGIESIGIYVIYNVYIDNDHTSLFVFINEILHRVELGYDYLNESKYQVSSIDILENFTAVDTAIWAAGPWSKEYYHWFANKLFKFYLISCQAESTAIVAGPQKKFVIETLDLLAPNYQVYYNSSGIIRVSKLFVSDMLPHSMLLKFPEYLRTLANLTREKYSLLPSESMQVIPILFISRDDAPVRRCINERWLIEQVQEQTGKPVYTVKLSDYSFLEQGHLIGRSQVVLSCHGAGLIHAMHLHSSSCVIEIFGNDYINYSSLPFIFYNTICYHSVVTSSVDRDPPDSGKPKDLYINLDCLAIVVNAINSYFNVHSDRSL
jgi:capsular polysaccharide biosynthesis protein